MTLTAVDIVLCLFVAALIGAVGYLFGRITADLGNEHQAPEKLEPRARPQTFDQWRMTGQQSWPAVNRGPDPAVSMLTLMGVIAIHDTLANLALADRLEAAHWPEAAPEHVERHKVTSPDLMALDVEAMIARYRDEIDELVDAADRKMGELTRA